MSGPRPRWRPRRGIDGELIELPATHLDRGAARPDRRAQPRSAHPRHPGPAAAAGRRSTTRRSCDAIAPGQGRRRLPSAECRPSVLGRPRAARRPAGPLHALRLPASPARDAGRRRPRRQGGGHRRPLQHRRQADGRRCCSAPTAPSPSPTRARATCPRSAAGPTSWSPPSAGRRSSRATGSSRAPR